MSQRDCKKIGRYIIKILRHEVISLKLKITTDGYVKLNDIFKILKRKKFNSELINLDTIKDIVKNDNKQRFDLINKNSEWLIRANQGHSINLNPELLLTIIEKPLPECIHGTYKKYLSSISQNGLNKQLRDQIHFTTKINSNMVNSGIRKSAEVAIYIDMKKAMEAGIKFYRSKNGVILSPGINGIIEPRFFSKIEML